MTGAAFFLCVAAVAIDGDTLRCEGLGKVRLARIDTPELSEPGGAEARAALIALIGGRDVHCRQIDALPQTRAFESTDRWGRIVARCSAGRRDLGKALRRAGIASEWPAKRG